MKEETSVRPCAVCGMFYPADPAELRGGVEEMIAAAGASGTTAVPRGIVAPHAGYMYSGPTAAAAYARLAGRRFRSVVIVAPSHREAFAGVSVYPGAAYETPLGRLEIDAELRGALAGGEGPVRAMPAGHREEHAVEVQLPFLQVMLGEFLLVPLVIGNQTRETCFGLGEQLGNVCRGRDVLLVASTDLSHYFPAEAAENLDRIAREDIARFNPERLMDDLDEGRAEACGGGPVVGVMKALRALGASRMEVVMHCTSGDVTGDRRSVVGYCSAVAWED